MCFDSVLKYLMRDTISLRQYIDTPPFNRGDVINIDDLKRRLFIIQRNINTDIPDHYYKKGNESVLDKLTSIVDLFTIGIPKFAENFLEIDTVGVVSVKEDQFIEWQNTIPIISPLFLISSFLSEKIDFRFTLKDIRKLFQEIIVPNTRNTSLAGPTIKTLQNFFSEKGGVSDLHIHLNGIIEADAVWQHLLSNTDNNVVYLNQKINTPIFKQSLEQLGYYEAVDLYSKLLERAKVIRSELSDVIIDYITEGNCPELSNKKFRNPSSFHPFWIFFENKPNLDIPNESLRYEALMYILVIRLMKLQNNHRIASLLHEYLLIDGFFSALCVQNMEENGFEQFQAKTINKVYSLCDNKYISKFLQLSGNESSNFKFIEFRLAPEEYNERTKVSVITELSFIDNSWKEFLKKANINTSCDYRLISHFIKKKDNHPHNNIAYLELRKKLQSQTKMLKYVHSFGDKYTNKLNAIDAAASEFDTPPEVFAPYYRELRQEGYTHFTYHAGEDFYHVLSGLRAMYEAVDFCDLRKGDRIGHGTAAGIPIREWINTIGDEIYMPIGEYMDDLLFCYYFILTRGISSLSNMLVVLESTIVNYYYSIFDKSYNIQDLIKAWKSRKLKIDVENSVVFNIKKEDLPNNKNLSENVFEILKDYNNKDKRKEYNKATKIAIEGIFNEEQLILLQKELLKYLHEKEIVIETLPTSNVRIGYHRSFDTYQLFNWYNWYKEGVCLPPIVMGTDDPGIFQTNIYNEYSLVYCYLVYEKHKVRNDVIDFIEHIYRNGQIYKFDN